MEGFRILLEHLNQPQWIKLRDSTDPKDKIHNCQIFWYSRRDPKTNRIRTNTKFRKSFCPWDLSRSSNEWEYIETPYFSNKDLSDYVHSIPQLVNRKEDAQIEGR